MSGGRGQAMLRITELMAWEVSREAGSAGRQADGLRAIIGAAADDVVVALRAALVRTVSTGTVEADRRLEPSAVAVDAACQIGLDGGKGVILARGCATPPNNGATLRYRWRGERRGWSDRPPDPDFRGPGERAVRGAVHRASGPAYVRWFADGAVDPTSPPRSPGWMKAALVA